MCHCHISGVHLNSCPQWVWEHLWYSKITFRINYCSIFIFLSPISYKWKISAINEDMSHRWSIWCITSNGCEIITIGSWVSWRDTINDLDYFNQQMTTIRKQIWHLFAKGYNSYLQKDVRHIQKAWHLFTKGQDTGSSMPHK